MPQWIVVPGEDDVQGAVVPRRGGGGGGGTAFLKVKAHCQTTASVFQGSPPLHFL